MKLRRIILLGLFADFVVGGVIAGSFAFGAETCSPAPQERRILESAVIEASGSRPARRVVKSVVVLKDGTQQDGRAGNFLRGFLRRAAQCESADEH